MEYQHYDYNAQYTQGVQVYPPPQAYPSYYTVPQSRNWNENENLNSFTSSIYTIPTYPQYLQQ